MMINESNKSMYNALYLKGREIFLNPSPLYKYDDIINGVKVSNKIMKAVDESTFQAFGYFNPNMKKVMQVYISYFLNNKKGIVSKLNSITTKEAYMAFEDDVYKQTYSMLNRETDISRLDSYNRVRKPINLYLEHIVAMAEEIGNRQMLVSLLLLPMDKFIFASPYIFTEYELAQYGVKKDSGFGVVRTKPDYISLQELVIKKADEIGKLINGEFYSIYFDLLWKDRYLTLGNNIFETNIKQQGEVTPSLSTTYSDMKNDNKFSINEYINRPVSLSTAPKFEAKYNKSSKQLQELFDNLIKKCNSFCTKCFPTNTPDFRLQKSVNFCLINFVNSKVRIHIRTDSLKLESELLAIRLLPNHHYNGWEWVEVAIDKESEVDEAVMLIEKAFRHAD